MAAVSPIPIPTAGTRWRCSLCGNLTRFDVTRSSRQVEYVHLDLAGVPTVEDRQVLSDVVEQIRCRWCQAIDQVELVPVPGQRVETRTGDVDDLGAVKEQGAPS